MDTIYCVIDIWLSYFLHTEIKPLFYTFLGFSLRYWSPNMIYQWFKVEQTSAMYISMTSLLPLSRAADRTGCFHLPLEPLLWLADCTLSDHWPGLSPVSFWSIWWSLAVNTSESHLVLFAAIEDQLYIYSLLQQDVVTDYPIVFLQCCLLWLACFDNIFLRMDWVKK